MMMKKKVYLVIGIIIVLVIAGIILVGSYIRQAKRNQTNLGDYCNTIQSDTLKYKSLKPPSEYIAWSDNKEFLDIWKELFIKNNKISESYFNEHIRISSDSKISLPHGENLGWDPNPNLDEYFEIKYYFIIDWLNLPMRDGFIIKYTNTTEYLTKEEILKIAGDVSMPIVKRPWKIDIGYIRNNDGNLIENIVSCDIATEKLTVLEPTLIPNQVTLRPFAEGLVMRARGKTGPNVCPKASIILTSGEIFNYSPNEPCIIF